MKRLAGVVLLTLFALSGCMGPHNRPVQLVSGAGPIYPEAARKAGVEGQVVVRYDVSVDGEVVNARIDSAEPAGVFDAAALTAVRSWKYNPQIRDGEPQAVQNVLSTVKFRLSGGERYDGY